MFLPCFEEVFGSSEHFKGKIGMLFIGVLIPVLFSTADEEMLVAPMLALIWEELSFVSPI